MDGNMNMKNLEDLKGNFRGLNNIVRIMIKHIPINEVHKLRYNQELRLEQEQTQELEQELEMKAETNLVYNTTTYKCELDFKNILIFKSTGKNEYLINSYLNKYNKLNLIDFYYSNDYDNNSRKSKLNNNNNNLIINKKDIILPHYLFFSFSKNNNNNKNIEIYSKSFYLMLNSYNYTRKYIRNNNDFILSTFISFENIDLKGNKQLVILHLNHIKAMIDDYILITNDLICNKNKEETPNILQKKILDFLYKINLKNDINFDINLNYNLKQIENKIYGGWHSYRNGKSYYYL
jgi:hypothetical protein